MKLPNDYNSEDFKKFRKGQNMVIFGLFPILIFLIVINSKNRNQINNLDDINSIPNGSCILIKAGNIKGVKVETMDFLGGRIRVRYTTKTDFQEIINTGVFRNYELDRCKDEY